MEKKNKKVIVEGSAPKVKKKRTKVGEIAYDMLTTNEKQPDISIDALQKDMQSEYMKSLLECVDKGYEEYRESFFIEVKTKHERVLQIGFRNYFIARRSCPTPYFDQSVFRYNVQKGQLEYLWTVPNKDAALYLKEHALIVHPAEKELVGYVLSYFDGSLLKRAKQLNNEKENIIVMPNAIA